MIADNDPAVAAVRRDLAILRARLENGEPPDAPAPAQTVVQPGERDRGCVSLGILPSAEEEPRIALRIAMYEQWLARWATEA